MRELVWYLIPGALLLGPLALYGLDVLPGTEVAALLFAVSPVAGYLVHQCVRLVAEPALCRIAARWSGFEADVIPANSRDWLLRDTLTRWETFTYETREPECGGTLLVEVLAKLGDFYHALCAAAFGALGGLILLLSVLPDRLPVRPDGYPRGDMLWWPAYCIYLLLLVVIVARLTQVVSRFWYRVLGWSEKWRAWARS
jgi:hypothetical protein